MKVKIKKLNQNSVIPKYSRDGDAGLDLTAASWEVDKGLFCYYTGIAVEIPEGHVGLIYPRSSISKVDLILSNHVGVIDSNYRGEIILKFRSTTDFPHIFVVGDRIAQLIIVPYLKIEFEEVEELSDTNRGSKGFGSSGA
jgi:dUTP pyrophosphatase